MENIRECVAVNGIFIRNRLRAVTTGDLPARVAAVKEIAKEHEILLAEPETFYKLLELGGLSAAKCRAELCDLLLFEIKDMQRKLYDSENKAIHHFTRDVYISAIKDMLPTLMQIRSFIPILCALCYTHNDIDSELMIEYYATAEVGDRRCFMAHSPPHVRLEVWASSLEACQEDFQMTVERSLLHSYAHRDSRRVWKNAYDRIVALIGYGQAFSHFDTLMENLKVVICSFFEEKHLQWLVSHYIDSLEARVGSTPSCKRLIVALKQHSGYSLFSAKSLARSDPEANSFLVARRAELDGIPEDCLRIFTAQSTAFIQAPKSYSQAHLLVLCNLCYKCNNYGDHVYTLLTTLRKGLSIDWHV